jgi:type VI secretion system secreted protein Hcp
VAFDAFLKLGDIVGDSTDKVHKGEIPVLFYSFGIANTGSIGSATGGAGAGKATFTDFNFTTGMSAASPKLMLACASGKHFPEALLTLRHSGNGPQGGFEFCRVTLKEVLITSYQDAGASSEGVPQESVALAFAAIKIEFTPQTPSGTPGQASSAGWDRTKNEPFNG